jgi:signal transduction histidine kinase
VPAAPSDTGLAEYHRHDRVLLSAVLICGLLIGYQLGVTLLQPPWIKPVTDWLRAALAWPELALVLYISVRFTRTHHPAAASWWMFSVAFLSYAVARTWWTVYDLYIYPNGVPCPTLPDLFFVLQYPFFFLALLLLPYAPAWAPRLRVMLDDLLWIGVAGALTWFFILAHIYLPTGESQLAKVVSLGYPIGDLIVFAGLAVALTRPSRSRGDRLALWVLCVAFLCLFAGDAWVAVLLTSHSHVYVTGYAPDVFWMAFYLLVPLAGLVQLRLTRYERPPAVEIPRAALQWRDVLASARELSPLMATLAACAALTVHAARVAGREALVIPLLLRGPLVVSLVLLALAIVRQVVASLEAQQLRREQESARANEAALRESNRRMEAFLSIVAHELRTPLTSLSGNLQLLARRLDDLFQAGTPPRP